MRYVNRCICLPWPSSICRVAGLCYGVLRKNKRYIGFLQVHQVYGIFRTIHADVINWEDVFNWTVNFVPQSPCPSSSYNLEVLRSLPTWSLQLGLENEKLYFTFWETTEVWVFKLKISSKSPCSRKIYSCQNHSHACVTAQCDCRVTDCNNTSLVLQDEDE